MPPPACTIPTIPAANHRAQVWKEAYGIRRVETTNMVVIRAIIHGQHKKQGTWSIQSGGGSDLHGSNMTRLFALRRPLFCT